MPNLLIDSIKFRDDISDRTYFISHSVLGYFDSSSGKFYKESTHTTEITGMPTLLYIDISNNSIYRYDETNIEFVQISGGPGTGDAIIYVDSLPITNIKNVIYGIVIKTAYSEIVEANFLDLNDLFEKTTSDNNYTYTAANGNEIEASIDDITYKNFTSLVYNDNDSEFILNYSDGTSLILVNNDTFYFKVINRKYYAGNETSQTVTPFASNGVVYTPGFNIDITNNVIKTREFVGTSAEWEALTPEQKAEYVFVIRTDDYGPIEVNPGHTILNNSGTEMVQRGFLQFGNELQVTDDSTNRITKVNAIPYTAGTGISITGHEISATGGGGGGLNNLIDGEAIESLVGNDTTNNKATGERATALGINTTASASGSMAEGNNTIASGNYSHAEGYMTSASGNYSHAEGYITSTSGNYGSHAEGSNTSASGNYSHAEGGGTLANGNASHAEGMNTRAKGMSSHAEGVMTTANGRYSHAEGYQTLATGDYAHAEGLVTTASGENSHAEGYGIIAQGKYQHVSGQYNIADTSDTYALIIGNGSNKNGNITTSNALTLDWDGNLKATSYANFSSRKYKENIQDMTDEEALKLLKLNPVTFDYKSDKLPNNQCGFIAEDVEKVITYPIIYENNEPDSIDYAKFVPALIKLVQIQQKQIDKLRAAASSDTNLD